RRAVKQPGTIGGAVKKKSANGGAVNKQSANGGAAKKQSANGAAVKQQQRGNGGTERQSGASDGAMKPAPRMFIVERRKIPRFPVQKAVAPERDEGRASHASRDRRLRFAELLLSISQKMSG